MRTAGAGAATRTVGSALPARPPEGGKRRPPGPFPALAVARRRRTRARSSLEPEALSVLSALLGVAGEPRLGARTLASLAANLARALGAPVLTVRLLDPTGRWLDLKASVGLSKRLRTALRRIPVESPAGRTIVGRGRRVLISDGTVQGAVLPPWPSALARRFGAGAFVPIRSGGTILGALGVAYRESARPPRPQLRFLAVLGRQLGAALQMVRTREARRKSRAEALTLRKITAALSSNLEPREVLDMVTGAAARLTRAAGAIVLLRSRDRTEFEVASQSDSGGRVHLIGLRFPAKGSMAARVARTGRAFRCRDARADPRPMIRALVGAGGVRGLLIVPLRAAGDTIGTLAVSSLRPRLFSDRDRRILIQLGQQASIAIQNARLFDAVRSHRQLLRQLYSEQFSTLEAERKRIAHELHDEMGPTLSATLINLQLAESLGAGDPAVSAKVRETVGLLTGIIEKVRELSYGLRPPMLEHLGLAESLRWMIETYFSAGSLRISYRHTGDDGALDPDLALAVYRIAQEALTNVVKHSGATRVRIRLRISAADVRLHVQDNGGGFEPGSQSSERRVGLGLASMRERMEQLSGRMEIRSAPGRGCHLTVSCPLTMGVSRARALG
jgi:signal transduction histidine kinase